MKNWTYNELIACINNNFQSQIDQGISISDTIGLVSSDFWFYPENECVIENLINIIRTLNLCIKHLGCVNEKSVAVYHKQLNLLTDELLNAQLREEEVILLKQSAIDLNEKLKNVEIVSD